MGSDQTNGCLLRFKSVIFILPTNIHKKSISMGDVTTTRSKKQNYNKSLIKLHFLFFLGLIKTKKK